MPINEVKKPQNCTQVGREVVEKLLKRATIGEPGFVCTMAANGLTQPYQEFTHKLIVQNTSYQVVPISIISDEDRKNALDLITQTQKPLMISVILGSKTDELMFIKELNRFRLLRENQFVPYVFSNISEIYSAYQQKVKIVDRGMTVLPLLSWKDMECLYAHYEDLYDWKFNNSVEKELLYKHSSGHVGLAKTLFILARERGEYSYSYDELLESESVRARLDEIVTDLPQEKVIEWNKVEISKSKDSFWTRFGFVVNNQAAFPLLLDYAKRILVRGNIFEFSIDGNLDKLLTATEVQIFNLLLSKIGNVVLREDIAAVLWGNEMFEHYSDWAIDQTIHRLRNKLNQAGSLYKIITKKGQGFFIHQ